MNDDVTNSEDRNRVVTETTTTLEQNLIFYYSGHVLTSSLNVVCSRLELEPLVFNVFLAISEILFDTNINRNSNKFIED